MKSDVLSVISSRRSGAVKDGFKLGLAVEGGGMRGIISAAATAYLAETKLLGLFDQTYGISAGAINIAYILSGNPWLGISIYYDHLALKDFVNRRRFVGGGPLLSMELVEDHIFKEAIPLKLDDISSSGVPLNIAVSDITNLEALTLSSFENSEELHRMLTAGAHIPILSGKIPHTNDRLLADGGLFHGNPIYSAIEDGCTHVLSFETRDLGNKNMRIGPGKKHLARSLDKLTKGAGDLYLETLTKYLKDRRELGPGAVQIGGAQVFRSSVPWSDQPVRRASTDPGVLLQGAKAGYKMASKLFDSSNQETYVFRIERCNKPPQATLP